MFIGRKKEINAIKEVLGSVSPGIVVIYGRRRIGKSELIKQSVKGISVFNFEGAEGQSPKKQMKNFPGKTIQKVLFTLSYPTKELTGSGYFCKVIRAKELLI